MVIFQPISWVTDEQIVQIEKGQKAAFVRMEDKWLKQLFEQSQKDYEIHLITGALRTRGWLIVTYIDYFKWKELKNQIKLIQKCGFKGIIDIKKYLVKLYGIELFGKHLDEKPYLSYIEFEYKPFP